MSGDVSGGTSVAGLRTLVAGARGGIGAAVVALLRERGARVCGLDRGDVDITTTTGANRAAQIAAEELGGLDAVVHAVGMSGRGLGDGPVTECTDEAWEEVLRVNLGSVFRLLRASLPHLARSDRGSFVAVGSVLADSADPDFQTVGYAASKGGLVSLARTSALQAARHGVRINVVSPGLVQTPMANRAITSARISARMTDLQPLHGRAVTPVEVAEAAIWLASPASSMTTGHVLTVDGGWLLR